MPKFTICIEAEDEPRRFVDDWLSRWKGKFVHLSENGGCGCCVDIYEIDGPLEAIQELPEEYISASYRSDWRSKADYIADENHSC